MRKSKKRIHGNDRFLMMLCRDARRRWMQYGENRKVAKAQAKCAVCNKRAAEQWDHIKPLGPRPRTLDELPKWLYTMIEGECQGLCKVCHRKKTDLERKKRKGSNNNG